MKKLSKKELVEYLVSNCVNEHSVVDLSGLDFTEYNVSVSISDMKVKNNLYQERQLVFGELWQGYQIVHRNLYQDMLTVKGNLFSHKLKEDEMWEERDDYVVRVKRFEEITEEELLKKGYKLKKGEK